MVYCAASNLEYIDITIERMGRISSRPVRDDGSVRIETEHDTESSLNVIHNYGYDGSGWTEYVGAVQVAISLINKI